MKKILILIIYTLIQGGCMNTKYNNPKELYLYNSKEYKEKVKNAEINIDKAANIVVKFIHSNNKFKEYKYMYFINDNAYVFRTYLNKQKTIFSGYLIKGLDGIYIDIHSGKLTIVNRSNDNYKYIDLYANFSKEKILFIEKEKEKENHRLVNKKNYIEFYKINK